MISPRSRPVCLPGGENPFIPASSVEIEEKEMKRAVLPAALMVFTIFFVSTLQAADIAVTYNINPEGAKTPISKYIYGSNWGSGTDYTIRRSGGNRLTAYNWENNWSNAGADWYYENDQYMSSSPIPGKAITDFHDQALSQGQASIVTLQMAGYVSAPIWRQINLDTEAAPSIYFYPVTFAKGAPFSNPPNTSDANVYMDEFIDFLVSTYGYAGQPNGVKFYDLDNEPDIWSDGNKGATHPEVHVSDPCCVEYKDKSVALSIAVKNVDPNAQMLGPVSYGFSGYLTFQGASDWASVQGSYGWFLSYYLDKMRVASNSAGKRLLDALDVHWYPEAYDGAPFTYDNGSTHRILDNINTTAMYTARMQAPRTLWDTGYVGTNGENSWINRWNSSYLPLITRLKNNINTYYPDTNLAITEYAYGPETHWSTGIATTDFLGICGKYGVYIATYWGGGSYVDAAIKIYRNYDGAHSTFGDTNVPATISDKVNSSIYASVSYNLPCELHLIVINKNIDNAISGTFNISSPRHYMSGRVWKFSDTSSNITETTAISTITNNSFTYTVPKTTVCHIVLQAYHSGWDLSGPDGSSDCRVDIYDLDAFANDWLIYGDYPNFQDFASFGQEWGM
jgi:hypothetical protein